METTSSVLMEIKIVVKGKPEEVMGIYRALIGKLNNSNENQRKLVILGSLSRYDFDSSIISSLLGFNSRVESQCREEENIVFVNIWDHFGSDGVLSGRRGLCLSRRGKARLGRVLYENIRQTIGTERDRELGEPRQEKADSDIQVGR